MVDTDVPIDGGPGPPPLGAIASLVAAYVARIDDLVAAALLADAVNEAMDMLRDLEKHLPPALRRDFKVRAIALKYQYSEARRNQRNKVNVATAMATIVTDVLDFTRDLQAALVPLAPPVRQPTLQSAPITSEIRQATLGTDETRPIVAALHGVTKQFNEDDFRLGPLTLNLRVGEITAVVGVNASGKSTLLDLIRGVQAPTKGTIKYPALEGDGMGWWKVRSRIGYVAQAPFKWRGRLRWNLNFAAAVGGARGDANKQIVDYYVSRYDLTDYQRKTWNTISAGYRTRFELVKTLLLNPRLLLLDEPLANLDIVTQQKFLQDLRSIATRLDRPVSVLVSSQQIYEIEAIADHIVVIDGRDVLYQGPVGQVQRGTGFRWYEFTIRGDEGIAKTALWQAGAQEIVYAGNQTYIVRTHDSTFIGQLTSSLSGALHENFVAVRDISGSARILFQEGQREVVA